MNKKQKIGKVDPITNRQIPQIPKTHKIISKTHKTTNPPIWPSSNYSYNKNTNKYQKSLYTDGLTYTRYGYYRTLDVEYTNPIILKKIIATLAKTTGIKIKPGEIWSANVEDKTITYVESEIKMLDQDSVIGLILHEAAHILYSKAIDKKEINQATESIINETNTQVIDTTKEITEGELNTKSIKETTNNINIESKISADLKETTNAIEDYRIEKEIEKIYPNAKHFLDKYKKMLLESKEMKKLIDVIKLLSKNIDTKDPFFQSQEAQNETIQHIELIRKITEETEILFRDKKERKVKEKILHQAIKENMIEQKDKIYKKIYEVLNSPTPKLKEIYSQIEEIITDTIVDTEITINSDKNQIKKLNEEAIKIQTEKDKELTQKADEIIKKTLNNPNIAIINSKEYPIIAYTIVAMKSKAKNPIGIQNIEEIVETINKKEPEKLPKEEKVKKEPLTYLFTPKYIVPIIEYLDKEFQQDLALYTKEYAIKRIEQMETIISLHQITTIKTKPNKIIQKVNENALNNATLKTKTNIASPKIEEKEEKIKQMLTQIEKEYYISLKNGKRNIKQEEKYIEALIEAFKDHIRSLHHVFIATKNQNQENTTESIIKQSKEFQQKIKKDNKKIPAKIQLGIYNHEEARTFLSRMIKATILMIINKQLEKYQITKATYNNYTYDPLYKYDPYTGKPLNQTNQNKKQKETKQLGEIIYEITNEIKQKNLKNTDQTLQFAKEITKNKLPFLHWTYLTQNITNIPFHKQLQSCNNCNVTEKKDIIENQRNNQKIQEMIDQIKAAIKQIETKNKNTKKLTEKELKEQLSKQPQTKTYTKERKKEMYEKYLPLYKEAINIGKKYFSLFYPIYINNKKTRFSGKYRTGKINKRKLYKFINNETKLFQKRNIIDKKEYMFAFVSDKSASTQTTPQINPKITKEIIDIIYKKTKENEKAIYETILQAQIAFNYIFTKLGIKTHLSTFSSKFNQIKKINEKTVPTITFLKRYDYVDFESTEIEQATLTAIYDMLTNQKEQTETSKTLILLTDGIIDYTEYIKLKIICKTFNINLHLILFLEYEKHKIHIFCPQYIALMDSVKRYLHSQPTENIYDALCKKETIEQFTKTFPHLQKMPIRTAIEQIKNEFNQMDPMNDSPEKNNTILVIKPKEVFEAYYRIAKKEMRIIQRTLE